MGSRGRATNINKKLIILGLLGGLFRWIGIGGAIAFVYFFYGALANEAPIRYLLFSIGAALVATYLADTFKTKKEQSDYVDQLMERGYTRADATMAWEIADVGGSNLLLNLQAAERIESIVPDDKGNDSNAK
jgi:hypothetical protein